MDRIKSQIDTYSKFGLNKDQLSALREILSRKGAQKIGTAITNSLIPDSATNALYMGERYVTPGTKDVLGAEVKNSQGFLKGRNNLIQFIDKYRTPSPSTNTVISTAQEPKITAQEFFDDKKAKVAKQSPTPSTPSVRTTRTKPATTTSTGPATSAKTIPVISDPMLEKLGKIDAKNTQQRIVDGLRGSGPGVKKLSAKPPKITMANSPRFSGLTAGGILKNVKGGLVDLVVGTAANLVTPHIAREAVRGGLVLTGRDTTAFDRINAGLPVVKNIDGVSYNISTEEGLKAALSATKKGGKESKPLDFPQSEIKSFADLRGSITPGSLQPAATNLGEGAAMDAAERYRPGAGFPAGITRPADYPVASTPPNPPAPPIDLRGPSAADLLKKFDSDTKKAEDEGMRIWAEKYKDTLAKKVKEGQAGFEVIQDTLYPKTEEGFANPDRPGVVEMLAGQKLETPMSINTANAVQDLLELPIKSTSALSVLAEKDPQKALTEFMAANGLINQKETVNEKDTDNQRETDSPKNVSIGDLRIPEGEFKNIVGPLGDIYPQLKGKGVNTTYDPITQSIRVLSTVDATGKVTNY